MIGAFLLQERHWTLAKEDGLTWIEVLYRLRQPCTMPCCKQFRKLTASHNKCILCNTMMHRHQIR